VVLIPQPSTPTPTPLQPQLARQAISLKSGGLDSCHARRGRVSAVRSPPQHTRARAQRRVGFPLSYPTHHRVSESGPCPTLSPHCSGFYPPTEHSRTAPATARPSLWWSGLLPRAPRRTRPGVSCTLHPSTRAQHRFPSQLSHTSPSSMLRVMLPSSSSIESASQSTGGTGSQSPALFALPTPCRPLLPRRPWRHRRHRRHWRHRRHRRRASYAATPKGRGPC